MPTAPGNRAPARGAYGGAGRSGPARPHAGPAAALALAWLALGSVPFVGAQAPSDLPGGYPPPALNAGELGDVGDTGLPAPWAEKATPGWPTPASGGMPFGGVPIAAPTLALGGTPYGGAPYGGARFGGMPTTDPTSGLDAGASVVDQSGLPTRTAATAEATGGGATSDGGPVRVFLSPVTLMLAEGGRSVAVALQDVGAPVQHVALDLRFDADRLAVTAIGADAMLSMNGVQVDFKHRLEPGRLRLAIALTAADPSQLPTGSPGIANVTFAAVSAGSAELTLNAGASSVTTADGIVRALALDAPVTVIANDAPAEAIATEVAVQSGGLVAASAPADEMGGGGGTGVAGMARDIAARLTAALGGLGGGDSTPLLAWLGVVVGAVVVTGLGYLLGRAPEPAGPRPARGLRGRRRGGVEIEHEVVEERR